jgi:hypothetical protein
MFSSEGPMLYQYPTPPGEKCGLAANNANNAKEPFLYVLFACFALFADIFIMVDWGGLIAQT